MDIDETAQEPAGDQTADSELTEYQAAQIDVATETQDPSIAEIASLEATAVDVEEVCEKSVNECAEGPATILVDTPIAPVNIGELDAAGADESENDECIAEVEDIEPARSIDDPLVSKSEVEQFLAEALETDKASAQDDAKILDNANAECDYWTDLNQKLIAQLREGGPTRTQCLDIIISAKNVIAALSDEVRSRLLDRQEGMDIIGKMVGRLHERVVGLPGESLVHADLPLLDVESLGDRFTAVTQNDLNAELARLLKAVSADRYKIIMDLRSGGDGRRKQFLYFIEKVVFPIIDGVDDGRGYSEAIVDELKAGATTEVADILSTWFSSYESLRSALIALLCDVSIHPMEVELGSPIDYSQHEPFDVETDSELPDESVKSVIRQGYEMHCEGMERYVVRSAQVIAVKN